jgi:hypothetical protein
MPHLDHTPQRLLDVCPLPARPIPQQSRRGWGTILGFTMSFLFILGLTLAGLGLPSPLDPVLIQTSNHR